MPILTFKDKGGNQIKVNSPDGSMPSESDLDGLFKQSYMVKNKSNPNMQGGANAPALVKARGDVAQKTSQNNNLDMAVGANQAGYNMSWPLSLMAKKALGDNGPNPQATSSGGKMLEDMGMIANPLAGEALDLAGKGLGGVKNAIKYMGGGEQAKLAETVRKAAYQAKTDAVTQFGDSTDSLAKANPTRSVSLRQVVDGINSNVDEMAPEAKAVLRKTPILKDLINDPKLSDNVSLEDTQKIINYIGTKVPSTIKANHLDIMDALNDIRASQLDAFPEMQGVRDKYGEFKNSFNSIKGKLKQGALIKNMADDFGDAEIKKNVTKILNKDMLDEVKKFQQAKQVLKAAGIVAKTVGYGTLAGAGLKEGGDLARKIIP